MEAASYDEALDNSKALENERDKLTAKDNSISRENKEKIEKLLPDNVDNIRLILEVEKIATPYGMALRDVKYDSASKDTTAETSSTPRKDYGIWELEFSTSGTYNNFINFIKDLEKNLRIVDISSVAFSSSVGGAGLNPSFTEVYRYQVKISTYWLKN